MTGKLMFHTREDGISEWCFRETMTNEIYIIEDGDHLKISHSSHGWTVRFDGVIRFTATEIQFSTVSTVSKGLSGGTGTLRAFARVPVGRPSGWGSNKDDITDAEAWAFFFEVGREATLESGNVEVS